MKYPHCTIDLECLDVLPTAIITSIATVFFDLEGNRASHAVNIDLESSMGYGGLTISPVTLKWWFKQSRAAQEAMLENPMDLHDALTSVAHFITANRANKLTCWTHATFDAPILNYNSHVADVHIPIHFREHRDIRTLTWLNRNNFEKLGRPVTMIPHNALHDAQHQADYISALLLNMMPAKPKGVRQPIGIQIPGTAVYLTPDTSDDKIFLAKECHDRSSTDHIIKT